MVNIHRLLTEMAGAEKRQRETKFLAPCVKGSSVRTRVAGIVCTFTPQPNNFTGWGIFQPQDDKLANLIEEADLPLISRYLQLFIPLRVRLAHRLTDQTWLAYPVNESDAAQRVGKIAPLIVHLVSEGSAFEQVIARFDGGAWWFEDLDRRADPIIAETLRDALQNAIAAPVLKISGLTPEMRTCYHIALQPLEAMRRQREREERQKQLKQQRQREVEEHKRWVQYRTDEERLRKALQLGGGGDLRNYQDRGDFWVIEWSTSNGASHSSAVSKKDLTVISSGICLSGRDRDFDLQSLVKVMEDVY